MKIFKVFLDTTRLSPIVTRADEATEVAKIKEVEDDLYSEYHNKMDILSKQ